MTFMALASDDCVGMNGVSFERKKGPTTCFFDGAKKKQHLIYKIQMS